MNKLAFASMLSHRLFRVLLDMTRLICRISGVIIDGRGRGRGWRGRAGQQKGPQARRQVAKERQELRLQPEQGQGAGLQSAFFPCFPHKQAVQDGSCAHPDRKQMGVLTDETEAQASWKRRHKKRLQEEAAAMAAAVAAEEVVGEAGGHAEQQVLDSSEVLVSSFKLQKRFLAYFQGRRYCQLQTVLTWTWKRIFSWGPLCRWTAAAAAGGQRARSERRSTPTWSAPTLPWPLCALAPATPTAAPRLPLCAVPAAVRAYEDRGDVALRSSI